MKKSIFILVSLLVGVTVSSQIKKPELGGTTINKAQINHGIKIPNIKNLSTADLSKLNLPTIAISNIQKNAKALSKWALTPCALKTLIWKYRISLGTEQKILGRYILCHKLKVEK